MTSHLLNEYDDDDDNDTISQPAYAVTFIVRLNM